MWRRSGLLGILVSLALLVSLAVPVSAAPLPHSFYGTLTIGGSSALPGTELTAVVTGGSGSYTTTVLGQYGSANPLDFDYLVVSGDDIEGGALIEFYADGDKADQTATFHQGRVTNLDLTVLGVIVTYELTMAVTGNGATTPAVGGHTYPANTVVDITATPDAGWEFVDWTGDVADPNSATTTVTVDGNKTVTANFQVTPVEYTLTMAVTGNGTTTPAVGDHIYPANTVVNITATPDGGWKFVNWTGDVADPNSATTTVTVDAHKTVTATFEIGAKGDFDLDGDIDLADFVEFAAVYGSSVPDVNYNAIGDFDDDGDIDLADFVEFAAVYGT